MLGRWWSGRTLNPHYPTFITRYHSHPINKVESDLKTGRTHSTTKCREKKPHQRLERAEMVVRRYPLEGGSCWHGAEKTPGSLHKGERIPITSGLKNHTG